MFARLALLCILLAACNPTPTGVIEESLHQAVLQPLSTHLAESQPTPTLTARPLPTLRPVERDTDQPFSTSDRPDDIDGYQIHFVYALPSDGVDGFLDINGQIEISAQAMNYWLHNKTGSRLRLDTYQGQLDVTFLPLPYTTEQISQVHNRINDLIEHWLKLTRPAQDKKIYVVYYDGLLVTPEGFCGLAPLPPNGIGQSAVLLLRGYNPTYDLTCPRNFTRSVDYAGFFEVTILHEVLHVLGLVAECAPNAEGGHVHDHAQDLMYYLYDGSYSPLFTELDYGNNDYYNHGQECPDLVNSIFLDPTPLNAQLPPRWQDSVRNIPPDPIGGRQ